MGVTDRERLNTFRCPELVTEVERSREDGETQHCMHARAIVLLRYATKSDPCMSFTSACAVRAFGTRLVRHRIQTQRCAPPTRSVTHYTQHFMPRFARIIIIIIIVGYCLTFLAYAFNFSSCPFLSFTIKISEKQKQTTLRSSQIQIIKKHILWLSHQLHVCKFKEGLSV